MVNGEQVSVEEARMLAIERGQQLSQAQQEQAEVITAARKSRDNLRIIRNQLAALPEGEKRTLTIGRTSVTGTKANLIANVDRELGKIETLRQQILAREIQIRQAREELKGFSAQVRSAEIAEERRPPPPPPPTLAGELRAPEPITPSISGTLFETGRQLKEIDPTGIVGILGRGLEETAPTIGQLEQVGLLGLGRTLRVAGPLIGARRRGIISPVFMPAGEIVSGLGKTLIDLSTSVGAGVESQIAFSPRAAETTRLISAISTIALASDLPNIARSIRDVALGPREIETIRGVSADVAIRGKEFGGVVEVRGGVVRRLGFGREPFIAVSDVVGDVQRTTAGFQLTQTISERGLLTVRGIRGALRLDPTAAAGLTAVQRGVEVTRTLGFGAAQIRVGEFIGRSLTTQLGDFGISTTRGITRVRGLEGQFIFPARIEAIRVPTDLIKDIPKTFRTGGRVGGDVIGDLTRALKISRAQAAPTITGLDLTSTVKQVSDTLKQIPAVTTTARTLGILGIGVTGQIQRPLPRARRVSPLDISFINQIRTNIGQIISPKSITAMVTGARVRAKLPSAVRARPTARAVTLPQFGVLQRDIQAQLSGVGLRTLLPARESVRSIVSFPALIPTIPLFFGRGVGLPPIGLGLPEPRRRPRRARPARRPRRPRELGFAPSLSAILFDITGPVKEDFFTGLEIRPIPTKKRRSKKKRKR